MSKLLFQSTGALRYFHRTGYKLIVEVDPEIVRYYRTLMPKYIQSNPQMFAPHISVVREEIPPNLDLWGKYEGQKAEFSYTGTVHFGAIYCWLNVFSTQLEEIRLELGLPVSTQYTLPPEGFVKCFHCTVGNFKEPPCKSQLEVYDDGSQRPALGP